eukprot:CAMPEP_0113295128 /NCGR_PEP_ID=MMETSP0008_2-20120614/36283_1 /TAXON_ID=97485 /ORGANISM="Prymnesium parvum" /LENGTH=202 /DNA_ID=CAMNT_0000147819 /DNA_START=377 /DNA_END=985 /DNA_ORIENTATION=- /assembly_acc=CAM_ASM_000153
MRELTEENASSARADRDEEALVQGHSDTHRPRSQREVEQVEVQWCEHAEQREGDTDRQQSSGGQRVRRHREQLEHQLRQGSARRGGVRGEHHSCRRRARRGADDPQAGERGQYRRHREHHERGLRQARDQRVHRAVVAVRAEHPHARHSDKNQEDAAVVVRAEQLGGDDQPRRCDSEREADRQTAERSDERDGQQAKHDDFN